MTENIKETVLMKCEHCGYEEEIPLNTLELLKDLRSEDDADYYVLFAYITCSVKKTQRIKHNPYTQKKVLFVMPMTS